MDDQRLTRIEDKIDKISDRLGKMETEQAAQNVVVRDHEKRSTTLEELVLPMKQREDEIRGAVEFLKYFGSFILGLCAIAEALHWFIK